MMELLVVLMIIGIAATIAIPKLAGSRNAGDSRAVGNTLETGWDAAQEYLRGERGQAQDDDLGDTFTGFTPTIAARLVTGVTWNQSTSLTPATSQAQRVTIYRANGNTIALCTANAREVLCKAEDGQAISGRYGPRYGYSTTSATHAIARACFASEAAARSNGDNPATCSALATD